MNKLRIYLAEDHALFRELVRDRLNKEPDMEVIGEAGDGETALREAIELQPDVALLDLSMPKLSGVQVAEQLIRECPRITILALTAHREKAYFRRMLQVNASGYVLKEAKPDELLYAIRSVASGGVYLDPRLAGEVLESYAPARTSGRVVTSARILRGDQRQKELSPQEKRVLLAFAVGLTDKEIATQLNISPKTVDTYKSRFKEKLGLRSRREIQEYAGLVENRRETPSS